MERKYIKFNSQASFSRNKLKKPKYKIATKLNRSKNGKKTKSAYYLLSTNLEVVYVPLENDTFFFIQVC